MMKNLLFILLYSVVSSAGLTMLKLAPQLVSLTFVVGFGLYGIGFLMWLYILKILPLSVAFPIAAGSLLVATQLGGVLVLGERFTALRLVGLIIISIGILVVYFDDLQKINSL
jgi:multidrug transporter EmrE-like cation transporter